MAWTYYTGVVEPSGAHFRVGSSDPTHTNIDHLVPKVVRHIWRLNDIGQAWMPAHAQMMTNNGKFVLPTLFDRNELASSSFPMGDVLRSRLRQFGNAMRPICSAVEYVNEVTEAQHAVGGKYWPSLRIASEILRDEFDFELLLSGPPTGGVKDVAFLSHATQENIWPLVSGFVLHPYSTNAGSAASPLSTSNPSAGTQLGWTWQRRRQVDGQFTFVGERTSGSPVLHHVTNVTQITVGDEVTGTGIPANTTVLSKNTSDATNPRLTLSNNASSGTATDTTLTIAAGAGAVGKHMWITEFGWVTKDPPGPFSLNLVVNESTFSTRITQSFQNWETHAEELKLRAACWFSWQDWTSVAPPDSDDQHPFKYSGIRTTEIGRYQHNGTYPSGPAPAVPWYYKDGGGQTGTTGAKAALDAFGEGTVDTGGTEAAPEVVTLAPPSAVDMDSAILRGTTDPNSLPTTYHYEYSLNPLPATDPLAMPVGFLPRTNTAAAGLVVAHPAEERPQNVENAAMPASGDLTAWRAAFTSTALSHYKASVNGQYTGTTDEIIQWAARKWGFHPDILRAVAVKESDWDQGQLGDARVTTALAASCTMPGDTTITVVDRDAIAAEPVEPIVQVGTGADYMRWGGTAAGPERLTGCTTHARFYPGSGTVASGQQVKGVWDSYGLFQMKRPYAWTTPHVHIPRDNSAFCADYYGQILRGYYNGLETWLSAYDPPTGPNTQAYEAGDLWGSIGAWYSGRWHDAAAEGYISSVQAILAARTWEGF